MCAALGLFTRACEGIGIAEALYYRYCMAEVVGDDDLPLWIP
jgi:hypothetical protein